MWHFPIWAIIRNCSTEPWKNKFKLWHPEELSSGFRLVILSKMIEQVVALRLVDHMTENNLMDPMQSSYRKGHVHSTEIALLRLHNDLVSVADRGCGVCLVLLHLSAEFDTTDLTILLTFLQGTRWFRRSCSRYFSDHISQEGHSVSLMKVSWLSWRSLCMAYIRALC